MMTIRTRMESRLRGAVGMAFSRRAERRAFTLVEVLLTLAIVVIISGLAWVSLQGPFARQRLRSAADAVRSEWCQARVDAMKSGHTYSFRYKVRGSHYHLGPQEADPSAAVSSSAAPAASADEEALGDEPLPPPVDFRRFGRLERIREPSQLDERLAVADRGSAEECSLTVCDRICAIS